ncbi:hypothetical protein GCM10022416_18100 [Actinomadura keratinilytica]|uniref:Uncharacterized protein n=1 Tax=Actinomadura keratinilytica TaxID=547461 RepID=A0ABP7YFZ3_9ACTN
MVRVMGGHKGRRSVNAQVNGNMETMGRFRTRNPHAAGQGTASLVPYPKV